jgi:hypothetical protein
VSKIILLNNLKDEVIDCLHIQNPTNATKVRIDADSANNVVVSDAFAGLYASPYPGRIQFDPNSAATQEIAHKLLEKLASEANLDIPFIDQSHPLWPLIITIVSNDQASDDFLDLLGKYYQNSPFDLSGALNDLQNWERLGAAAWSLAEVQSHGQLADLLEKLAQPRGLCNLARTELRSYRWFATREYTEESSSSTMLRKENPNHQPTVVHDNRHYLLFGQNEEHITPQSWFNAAWKFIEHFRCNFGMFVTEAMLYKRVTIVGSPDIDVPVTKDDQFFLEEYTGYQEDTNDGTKERYRHVERLYITNADQLTTILNDRIEKNLAFEGGDIIIH